MDRNLLIHFFVMSGIVQNGSNIGDTVGKLVNTLSAQQITGTSVSKFKRLKTYNVYVSHGRSGEDSRNVTYYDNCLWVRKKIYEALLKIKVSQIEIGKILVTAFGGEDQILIERLSTDKIDVIVKDILNKQSFKSTSHEPAININGARNA